MHCSLHSRDRKQNSPCQHNTQTGWWGPGACVAIGVSSVLYGWSRCATMETCPFVTSVCRNFGRLREMEPAMQILAFQSQFHSHGRCNLAVILEIMRPLQFRLVGSSQIVYTNHFVSECLDCTDLNHPAKV